MSVIVFQMVKQLLWNILFGLVIIIYIYVYQTYTTVPQAVHDHHILNKPTEAIPALHIQPDLNNGHRIKNESVTTGTTCSFKMSIFYLKVHKTASSTTTTLLYMLAWNHRLSIVPVKHDPYPSRYIKNYVMTSPGKHIMAHNYSILAEHVIYNEHDIKLLMPQDTVYIATIRYPLAQFKSAFIEYNIPRYLGIKNPDPVKSFLQNVNYYSSKMSRYIYNLATNGMIKEFGLNPNKVNNESAVDQMLKYIEKRFDLIILTDYYDESLILLRRLMCWEMKDIIYLSQRERKYRFKYNIYDSVIRQAHRKLSNADYLLYEYFVKIFQLKLASQPKDFWAEVYQFKQANSVTTTFCSQIEKRLKMDASSIYKMNRKQEGVELFTKPYGGNFVLTAVDCAMMHLHTHVLRNVLKVYQMPMLCSSLQIQRRSVSIETDITWRNYKYIYINQLYCSKRNLIHNISLDILATKHAYMWMN